METYVAALGVQNARDPDTANGGAPFHWERIRVKGLALGYAFEKIRLRGEGGQSDILSAYLSTLR